MIGSRNKFSKPETLGRQHVQAGNKNMAMSRVGHRGYHDA